MFRKTARCVAPAFFAAMLAVACDDSGIQPMPADTASVSGRVVFEETGQPAVGVDVVLERCQQQMMSSPWRHSMWTQTDSTGCFYFEYRHEQMHRYRVAANVPVRGPGGECYLRELREQDIVLRVPAVTP